MSPVRVVEVKRDSCSGYIVKATWGRDTNHNSTNHRIPVETVDSSDGLSEHGDESDDDDILEIEIVGGRTEVKETGKEGSEITLSTPHPPLLCTGFEGSVKLGIVKDLFTFASGGAGCLTNSPLLSKVDESTKTPGLFLVGPAVRHGHLSFCFVYKFRQRFCVVANAIAKGLGHNTAAVVEVCRNNDMFMDDFSVCHGACGETC